MSKRKLSKTTRPTHEDSHWPVADFHSGETLRSRPILKPGFQRKDNRWDTNFKREYIETLLFEEDQTLNWIYVYEQEDGYYIMDGLQRTTTTTKFIDNKFTVHCEGKEVHYRDLPKKLQKVLRETPLPVRILKNYTLEQITSKFLKLNNCKPLTSTERIKASDDAIMTYIKKESKGTENLISALKGRGVAIDQKTLFESVFIVCGTVLLEGQILSFNKLRGSLAHHPFDATKKESTEKVLMALALVYGANSFKFGLTKTEVVSVGSAIRKNPEFDNWKLFGLYLGKVFHAYRTVSIGTSEGASPEVTNFYKSMQRGGIGSCGPRVALLCAKIDLVKKMTAEEIEAIPVAVEAISVDDEESTGTQGTTSTMDILSDKKRPKKKTCVQSKINF